MKFTQPIKILILVCFVVIVAMFVYAYTTDQMKLNSIFQRLTGNTKSATNTLALSTVSVRGVPATYMGQNGGGVLVSDTSATRIYKLMGNRMAMGAWFEKVAELDRKDGSMPVISLQGVIKGQEDDVVTTSSSYPIPSGPDVWGKNTEVWKDRAVHFEVLEVTSISWR